MTFSRGAFAASPALLQRALLLYLAALLLVCGFAGRSGVQVVDGDTAARLFARHLHGVLGEAEYVNTYGGPAPFVHPHCHAPLRETPPQPGPDEVQAASSLAGAMICDVPSFGLAAPSVLTALPFHLAVIAAGITLQPPAPPPQG